MPKSRGRRPPKSTGHQRQSQEEAKKWWTGPHKFAAWLIGSVVALIGFASAVVTFLPRPTVDGPSNPYEMSLPISFVIGNANIVPLENVQPMLGLCTLVFGSTDRPQSGRGCGSALGSRLVRPQWLAAYIGIDDKHTITIEDMFKGQISYADISIILEYSPWFLPWRREKEFRFETRKLGDGKIYWFIHPGG